MELDNAHWQYEGYTQRVTRKQWRDYLLTNTDTIIYKGRLRKLKVEKVFADILDLYKEPLKE